MNPNTGGPAFPIHGNGMFGEPVTLKQGMTLLDWFAGQETIRDEELVWGICEHYAGPRPSGDWKTNPVGWHEWESRWRAGVKYGRASAMLAEKARREGVVQESKTTDHFPDATKMAKLEALNRELVEALIDLVSLVKNNNAIRFTSEFVFAESALAKAKEVA